MNEYQKAMTEYHKVPTEEDGYLGPGLLGQDGYIGPESESREVTPNRTLREWVGEVVEGDAFQTFMSVVIMANSILIGLEIDRKDLQWLWEYCGHTLMVIFCLELMARLYFLRCEFFVGGHGLGWNYFDFMIVSTSVFDLLMHIFYPKLADKYDTMNKLMKMLRILRIFRLLRLLKMFKQLYLLANGLVDSAVAVFWVGALCVVMLYICALVLTRLLGHVEIGVPDEEFFRGKFGSVPTSMFTLFELMANPDLSLYEPAMRSPGMVFFFILFIIFGSFAMLSILTGVISESMMQKSNDRKEELRFQEEMRKREIVVRVKQYFQETDEDGDGNLSREEFQKSLPNMVEMFSELGFTYTQDDLSVVFDLVDFDGGGSIELDEFLQGMTSFTANVSDLPMNMLRLQFQISIMVTQATEKLETRINALDEKMTSRVDTLEKQIANVETGVFSRLDRIMTSLGVTPIG